MSNAVIVADGIFPVHEVPLGYLGKAGIIVCCDGSTASLLNAGMIPDAIVGDMDSLSDEWLRGFRTVFLSMTTRRPTT